MTSSPPAAVAVEELSKRFGRTSALERLTLRIAPGTAVAVLGPNGAGKTTFLRLCATLLRPSGGRIEVLGIDPLDRGAGVRRRIGFIGHESFLYPDLTPVENLTFYARLFRLADPERRIADLLERLRLRGWSHRPVRTLSRGLLQRCAVARALLHEPELLLLDEPYTGLDFAAADQVQGILVEARRRGTTLVMSTHDIARAVELCDTAVVLVGGRLALHTPCTDHESFESEYRRVVGAS